MLSLRECYKLLISILELDLQPENGNFPAEWHNLIEGVDRVSLFMLTKIATEYEDQAEELYCMTVDYSEHVKGEINESVYTEKSHSSLVADFFFEQAHRLPASSRNLEGPVLALFFWYLNEESHFDLLEEFGTKKRAYEVIAAIHGLRPSYVEKKFKECTSRTNRINGKDAPRQLHSVLNSLPETARSLVAQDYVDATDKSKDPDLPKAFKEVFYQRAKKYIK